jgi:ribosomal protein S18 acetylase RimI-like enzyme
MMTTFISYGSEISLVALHRSDVVELAAIYDRLAECHFEAFRKAYESSWSDEQDDAVRQGFFDEFDRFYTTDGYLLVLAMQDDTIVGWMSFAQEKYGVYLDELCVDPAYWGQGIGKALISSIKDYVPDVASIFLLTRKINEVSPHFYEHLGFRKSAFMLPEYSPDFHQGYELRVEHAE